MKEILLMKKLQEKDCTYDHQEKYEGDWVEGKMTRTVLVIFPSTQSPSYFSHVGQYVQSFSCSFFINKIPFILFSRWPYTHSFPCDFSINLISLIDLCWNNLILKSEDELKLFRVI
jgi:hypothetical protein